MKLPSHWDAVFTDAFYDKSVNLLVRSDTYDAEGGLVTTLEDSEIGFVGNVRYDNLDAIQENYGIQEKIDLAITTATSSAVELNDIVRYGSRQYLVITVIPFDSHKLVACRLWK